MTVTVAIVVSALVSLSLTPMLAGRFLKPSTCKKHGWLYRLAEGGFNGLANGYKRTLDVALRHPGLVLMSFFASIARRLWLFLALPKGFFPIQDTGFLIGQSQAARVRFAGPDEEDLQQQLGLWSQTIRPWPASSPRRRHARRPTRASSMRR